MSSLAARLREHISNGDTDAVNADGLLAVLDKCDQIRRDADSNSVGNTFWVQAITDEFEQTIARALGLTD